MKAAYKKFEIGDMVEITDQYRKTFTRRHSRYGIVTGFGQRDIALVCVRHIGTRWPISYHMNFWEKISPWNVDLANSTVEPSAYRPPTRGPTVLGRRKESKERRKLTIKETSSGDASEPRSRDGMFQWRGQWRKW